MSCNSPIGVFDSGVGGLTVAKEIMRQLPDEQIVYFGDTARVPYGSKSKKTITTYTRQIVRFLQSKDVKAIVVACNTASAYALETVRKEVPVPMIGIYTEFLSATNPNVTVFGKACPLFVPLVEEGWLQDPITVEVAKRYISELLDKDIDTLVLGCTHYPLLRKLIREVVGERVTLVNPAYETAVTLRTLLQERGLAHPKRDTLPEHTFFVSDGADKFREFANSILPCEVVETKDVNIESFEEEN